MTDNIANQGARVALSAVVLPSHLGASAGWDVWKFFEPVDDANYERAQILWENTPDGTIGRARIGLPKGVFTHLLYFQQNNFRRATKLPQPVVFDRPGWLDVDVKATDFMRQAGIIK